MSNDDDDKDGRKPPHRAPILRPPGFGGGGSAPGNPSMPDRPPGANDKLHYEGPFYLASLESDRLGRNPAGGQDDSGAPPTPDPPDKSLARFSETGDADVDREYSKQDVMVREDGTELHPGTYDDEMAQMHGKDDLEPGPENDPELDAMHARDDLDPGPDNDPDIDDMHAPNNDQAHGDDGPDHDGPDRLPKDRGRGR